MKIPPTRRVRIEQQEKADREILVPPAGFDRDGGRSREVCYGRCFATAPSPRSGSGSERSWVGSTPAPSASSFSGLDHGTHGLNSSTGGNGRSIRQRCRGGFSLSKSPFIAAFHIFRSYNFDLLCLTSFICTILPSSASFHPAMLHSCSS